MSEQTTLKDRIQADMKAAMKARDKDRLGAVRLILAAVKQKEVDERVEVDDTAMLALLDKMAKQRRESIAQYESAGREDLADKERQELDIITSYLPKALDEAEIDELVRAALTESGAESVKDMGKVMAVLRPKVQGRADMSAVSARVKAALAG
ncbi:MAG: GatB/YqeY domain-containing protein [Chromatiales bacterium]|nr:GatB/YqeY domain-containing protein [Chromatiales bacterium]